MVSLKKARLNCPKRGYFFVKNYNCYTFFMAKRLYIQLHNSRTGESLTLPLNPETTDITNEREIRTHNILGYGEVSIGGDKQLKRLTLSNVLPDANTYFSLLASLVRKLDYKPYSLQEASEMLNSWVDNNDIIRVIISDYLNAEFRIASFIAQVRESVPDLGYTIELVEYRNPENPVIETVASENKLIKLITRPIKKYIPSSVIAQSGQTIYKLAKLTYGGKFQELAQKNNITDANIDIAGQVVEMLPL